MDVPRHLVKMYVSWPYMLCFYSNLKGCISIYCSTFYRGTLGNLVFSSYWGLSSFLQTRHEVFHAAIAFDAVAVTALPSWVRSFLEVSMGFWERNEEFILAALVFGVLPILLVVLIGVVTGF